MITFTTFVIYNPHTNEIWDTFFPVAWIADGWVVLGEL